MKICIILVGALLIAAPVTAQTELGLTGGLIFGSALIGPGVPSQGPCYSAFGR